MRAEGYVVKGFAMFTQIHVRDVIYIDIITLANARKPKGIVRLKLVLDAYDTVLLSIMTSAWQQKLKPSGLYYDGFISGSELSDLLECHRRETASTFGTRKSSCPTKKAATSPPACQGPTTKASCTENVSKSTHTYTHLQKV